MSISKREISMSEVLGTYLSYTPSSTETHEFYADLRTMNHTLLRDAIAECQAAKKEDDAPADITKRQLIHSVNTRKVKELASLYPFLFATENALRSLASESYQKAFGDAYWWRVITNAAAEGKDANDFPLKADSKKRIRSTAVNPVFLKECFFGVKMFSGKQRAKLEHAACSAICFYEELTIRHLFNLIHADLSICPIGDLNRSDFNTHMVTICDARNEVFHGRPIKNRSSVFGACEIILDATSFHMGDFDEALRKTTYVRQSPQITRSAKHLLPPRSG